MNAVKRVIQSFEEIRKLALRNENKRVTKDDFAATLAWIHAGEEAFKDHIAALVYATEERDNA